jgi:hypothetical protein
MTKIPTVSAILRLVDPELLRRPLVARYVRKLRDGSLLRKQTIRLVAAELGLPPEDLWVASLQTALNAALRDLATDAPGRPPATVREKDFDAVFRDVSQSVLADPRIARDIAELRRGVTRRKRTVWRVARATGVSFGELYAACYAASVATRREALSKLAQ